MVQMPCVCMYVGMCERLEIILFCCLCEYAYISLVAVGVCARPLRHAKSNMIELKRINKGNKLMVKAIDSIISRSS